MEVDSSLDRKTDSGTSRMDRRNGSKSGRSSRDLAFLLLPAAKVDDDLLKQCANLFSNHYGYWGPNAGKVKPGSRVKMSAERLKNQCLHDSKRCFVVVAIQPDTDEVVGHVFYSRFYYAPGQGDVLWITQLVVHESWRGVGVGRRLCRLAWDGENTFACGIVSANPIAVRCLESMAGERCNMAMIKLHGLRLAAASGIDFVTHSHLTVNKSLSVLSTKFFVDHKEVADILTSSADWQLGRLQEGEEYFAFCFPPWKPNRLKSDSRCCFFLRVLRCCFNGNCRKGSSNL